MLDVAGARAGEHALEQDGRDRDRARRSRRTGSCASDRDRAPPCGSRRRRARSADPRPTRRSMSARAGSPSALKTKRSLPSLLELLGVARRVDARHDAVAREGALEGVVVGGGDDGAEGQLAEEADRPRAARRTARPPCAARRRSDRRGGGARSRRRPADATRARCARRRRRPPGSAAISLSTSERKLRSPSARAETRAGAQDATSGAQSLDEIRNLRRGGRHRRQIHRHLRLPSAARSRPHPRDCRSHVHTPSAGRECAYHTCNPEFNCYARTLMQINRSSVRSGVQGLGARWPRCRSQHLSPGGWSAAFAPRTVAPPMGAHDEVHGLVGRIAVRPGDVDVEDVACAAGRVRNALHQGRAGVVRC